MDGTPRGVKLIGKGPKAPANTLSQTGSAASSFGNLANTWSQNAAAPIGAASQYYTSLLNGGAAAQNAVAPSAMNIRSLYQGNQSAIQNFMPQGGEKNYALLQNNLAKTGSIANLYANVQPQAAQSLASLGGMETQASQGYGSLDNQNLSNLIGYQASQNQQKGQSLGGIGAGIGSLGGTLLGSKAPWFFS